MKMKSTARVLHSIAREHIPEDVDLLPDILAQIEKGTRPKMKTRTMLLVAFATFILIAGITFFSIPGAVNAMLRLFGYVQGMGAVDQGSSIRVLAEPVTVTREGISITVTSAILANNRTHIDYRIFGVPRSAYPDREDVVGCMQDPYMRLPNGSQLTLTGEDYPPVPAGENHAVFVMPCILHTLPGKAPTNWELDLSFKPAPPDLTVMPVIDVTAPPASTPAAGAAGQPEARPAATTQPTPAEAQARVIKEIETPDGYILVIQLPPHDRRNSPDHLDEPEKIVDANGKRVAYSNPSDLDPNQLGLDPAVDYSYVQFKAAGLAYPLTISFAGYTTGQAEPGATAEFTFDAGTNPQVGQEWTPNQAVQVAGHTLQLQSIEANSRNGYNFSFQCDADVVTADVEIPGYKAYGWGDSQTPGAFERRLYYKSTPTGLLTVKISNLVVIRNTFTWSGQWSPASPRTDLPANPTLQPGLCLTADGLAGLQPAPRNLTAGSALVYQKMEGSDRWGLVLYGLDGSEKQVVAANAAWGVLSPDGSQVAYSPLSNPAADIHIMDLGSQAVRTLSGVSGIDYRWSPDGSRIAYAAVGVYVVDADGAQNRQISELSGGSAIGWSPDGTRLYFTAPYTGNSAWKVYAFDLASGQTRELFTIENGTVKALNPRLSPDGQWIAYQGSDGSLYLVRTDGSDMRQALENMRISGIEWTSSGWLAVSLLEENGYNQMLLLVDPDGCAVYRLMEVEGSFASLYLP